MIRPARAAAGLGAAILLAASAPAQEIIVREGAPESAGDQFFVVPFLFQNDTIGTAVGATAAARGWPQPQSLTYLTGVASTEGTAYLYLRGSEIQWPGADRLFLDLRLSAGHFSRIDTYVDGQPDFADEVAGSHDSSADNFVESEGEDILARLEFGYVLPLGDGANLIKPRVTLRDGIRVDGGRSDGGWNPLQRGTTTLRLTPFYRTQDVTSDERGDEERTTSGLEFALQHDHTDFSENPTRGSFQQVRWAQDFGGLGSSAPWETWDVTLTKYVNLGASASARQRVLALSAWWIDTPSWDERDGGGVDDPYRRPPVYAGATLGGLERLRGFPQGRFHDRSAVYYGAEYRHTLDWNPLRGSALLRWLRVRVDWLQAVAFAEAGRVHDEFDPAELHSDLHTSGGLGLRAFANHLVIRADLAVSEEDTLVQMTIDHPF
jgi:hypothetical protein